MALVLPVGLDEAYKHFFRFANDVIDYELEPGNLLWVEIDGKRHETISKCIIEVGMSVYYRNNCTPEEKTRYYDKIVDAKKNLEKTIDVPKYFQVLKFFDEKELSKTCENLRKAKARLIEAGSNPAVTDYFFDKAIALSRFLVEDVSSFALYVILYKRVKEKITWTSLSPVSAELNALFQLTINKMSRQMDEVLKDLENLIARSKL